MTEQDIIKYIEDHLSISASAYSCACTHACGCIKIQLKLKNQIISETKVNLK